MGGDTEMIRAWASCSERNDASVAAESTGAGSTPKNQPRSNVLLKPSGTVPAFLEANIAISNQNSWSEWSLKVADPTVSTRPFAALRFKGGTGKEAFRVCVSGH